MFCWWVDNYFNWWVDRLGELDVCSWKKVGICICIDFRFFNGVLKCEYYKFLVLDDVLFEFMFVCKFLVCDLKFGYLYCEFDYELSLLIIFVILFGCFWWLCFFFGLKVSSEIF